MKFSYTALTKDNQKITGTLEAENSEAAQAQLHKEGVAILSVQAISDEEFQAIQRREEAARKATGIRTFFFSGTDENGKAVEGTIDATDDLSAFKRLRAEYRFQINALYPAEATEAEKLSSAERLKAMEAELAKQPAAKKTEKKEEGALDEREKAMAKTLSADIDRLTANVKKILGEHPDFFSVDRRTEIEKTLGNLERIRASNNLKHIAQVSGTLYDLISHPDHAEGKTLNASFESLKKEVGDSTLIKQESEFYKRAVEATGIRNVLKAVANRLKGIERADKKKGWLGGLFKKKTDKEGVKAEQGAEGGESAETSAPKKPDFTYFFVEIDSFIGWLLFVYILYFFMAGLSLEKNVGLSRDFVFKTLQPPYLVNIALFLLIFHLAMRLRNLHFRHNAPATFFLILLSLGVYALAVANF